MMAAGFAIPIVLGAALDFLALRGAPEVVTLSVLALTGGELSAVVVEEMVSETHQGDTSSVGPIFLTAGFPLVRRHRVVYRRQDRCCIGLR